MTTENDHLKKKREWKTQYEIGCVAEMSNSHLDIVQQTHAWVSFGDYNIHIFFAFILLTCMFSCFWLYIDLHILSRDFFQHWIPTQISPTG